MKKLPARDLRVIGLSPKATVLLLCTVAAACLADTGNMNLAHRVRIDCPPALHDEFYFSNRTFARDASPDLALRRMYSTYLRTTQEPSFLCGKTLDEAYRVIWDPRFDPRRVVIRVSRMGNNYALVATEIASTERNSGLSVTRRVERAVTAAEFASLSSALQDANFWFTPTQPIKMPFEGGVLDGDTWVIEGLRRSMHHVVTHGPIDSRNTFPQAYRLFFELAGFERPTELSDR